MDGADEVKYKRRRHRRTSLFITYNCAVCGDQTNCYNFGVPACEGCKGFYRRHMNRMDTMVCLKGGNCDINALSRKTCPACRMRKCCAVGMRKDPLTKESPTMMKPLEKNGDEEDEGTNVATFGLRTDAVVICSDSEQMNPSIAPSSRPHNSSVDTLHRSRFSVDTMASTSTFDSDNSISRLALLRPTPSNSLSAEGFIVPSFSNPSSVGTSASLLSPLSTVPPKKRRFLETDPCSSSRQDFATSSANRNPIGDFNPAAHYNASTNRHNVNVDMHREESALRRNAASFSHSTPSTLKHKIQPVTVLSSEQPVAVPVAVSVSDRRSAFRPVTRLRSEPENSAIDQLDSESDYPLSELLYDRILTDCVDLATTLCAPWRRVDVGDLLYENPTIEDARYLSRFMEARIHRVVISLKRARCFTVVSNEEKSVLIKAALFNLMLPMESFSASQTGLGVVEQFDNGAVCQRYYSGVATAFDQFGFDVRQLTDLAATLHKAARSANLSAVNWRVVLAAVLSVVIFAPKSWSEMGFMNANGQGSLSSSFESRVSLVRCEYLAFLRQFIFGNSTNQKEAIEAWRACLDLFTTIRTIGTMCQNFAMIFFQQQPDLIKMLLPVIDETVGRFLAPGGTQ